MTPKRPSGAIAATIKYALLIMRADNHGEGGILALLALISPRRARQSRRRAVMVQPTSPHVRALSEGDGMLTGDVSPYHV